MNAPGKSGLAARQAATSLLSEVLSRGKPFDDLFQRECATGAMAAFEARDRALVRLIAATVLRRKGQIDDALSRFLKQPLPRKSGDTLHILQAACAQLLFLDTPPHAAIDLAVRSADADRNARPFKGLVNAVLRRVAENSHDILASQNAPRLNTPPWLWQRWCRTYGEDTTRAMALCHLNEPSLDLTPRENATRWCDKLGGHLMPIGTIRLTHAGRVSDLEGYEEGAWWVQDAAAALPATLFGDIAGKPVLELCAAPGGKTAQLAAAGAQVTAVDVSKQRTKRLRENLSRLRLDAECIVSSVTKYAPEEAPGRILLDAPCTSTGTIRRHPDIAYTKSEATVADMAAVQGRMLDHAIGLLAPGGTLIFCTCSLEPEEGEHHAARLVDAGVMARIPVEPQEIGGMSECITAEGDLRTLPGHYRTSDPGLSGLDGFFCTRLRKL